MSIILVPSPIPKTHSDNFVAQHRYKKAPMRNVFYLSLDIFRKFICFKNFGILSSNTTLQGREEEIWEIRIGSFEK